VILGSEVQVWAANDAPVSPVDATDAPIRPVDASANANRVAVMHMIFLYIAESTIHRMSDLLKWWAENGCRCSTVFVPTTN